MEIRFGANLKGKIQNGFIQTLESFLKIVTGIHVGYLQSVIPIDMFDSRYLPYEASRTYSVTMTEFECKRSHGLVEAQRQMLRAL